jgi:peptidoglycan/LPS O-acetylase OafA/YrhL
MGRFVGYLKNTQKNSSVESPLGHFKKIDGLRFVAIALVLVEHFGNFIGRQISAGYYGVDLFFVISGFLISSILLNSEGDFFTSYRNFLIRRAFRIFPIYYLTLGILVALGIRPVKEYALSYLTYTFNYAWVYYEIPYNPGSHFWSLCVEEQFYVFWPIIILLLRRNTTAIVCIIVALSVFSFSQLVFEWIEELKPYNFVGLPTRMGSLSLGALAAVIHRNQNLPQKVMTSRSLEYFALTILLLSLLTDYKIKYISLALVSTYLVLKCAHSDFHIAVLNKLLTNNTIVFVGSISYGIYVFHLPLEFVFTKFFDSMWLSINFENLGPLKILRWNSWIIELPLLSGLSIFAAWISYKFVEGPILRFRNKYF